MALQLSAASSFNSGSQLWVIPDALHSEWYNRLNWYTNFLLTKNEIHKKRIPSLFLQETFEHCFRKPLIETERINKRASQTSSSEESNLNLTKLLVSTGFLLPTKWVLVCPFNSHDLAEWTKEISLSWHSLLQPNLRVFLPTKINANEFSTQWLKLGCTDDISLVLDLKE